MKNMVNCPVCDSKSEIMIKHPISSHGGIYECNKCEFYFSYPILNEIKSFYNFEKKKSKSALYNLEKYKQIKTMYIECKIRCKSQYNFFIKHLESYNMGESKNIFDVGCGCGILLNEFKKNGWNCIGLEPNIAYVEYGKKKYKLNIIGGYIDDIDFKKNSFNIIILSHVLEHLPNINESIGKLKGLLEKGGYIFIEVPNANHKLYKTIGFKDPHHLSHFTPKTLEILMQKFGFKIISIQNLKVNIKKPSKKIMESIVYRTFYEKESRKLIQNLTDTFTMFLDIFALRFRIKISSYAIRLKDINDNRGTVIRLLARKPL